MPLFLGTIICFIGITLYLYATEEYTPWLFVCGFLSGILIAALIFQSIAP